MEAPPKKYRGTMSKGEWRALYLRIELKSPRFKAAEQWIMKAAEELFDVASVIHKPGRIMPKDFEGSDEDLVTLTLSKSALLGIKYAVVGALMGEDDGKPSNLVSRRELLGACQGIGPDGKFRRIVMSEARIQDDEAAKERADGSLKDLDEAIDKELDGAQEEKAKSEAASPKDGAAKAESTQ